MIRLLFPMLALALAGPTRAEVDFQSANFWYRQCKSDNVGACIAFIAGMDGVNDLVRIEGQHAFWCTPKGVTYEQMRIIILNGLEKVPEGWHEPFYMQAAAILRGKYTCAGDKRAPQ